MALLTECRLSVTTSSFLWRGGGAGWNRTTDKALQAFALPLGYRAVRARLLLCVFGTGFVWYPRGWREEQRPASRVSDSGTGFVWYLRDFEATDLVRGDRRPQTSAVSLK